MFTLVRLPPSHPYCYVHLVLVFAPCHLNEESSELLWQFRVNLPGGHGRDQQQFAACLFIFVY